ncbi:hypothetical protein M153_24500010072 [Pseudoloma neurophilia]|uniref:Uncharacterized protein n=1 Tax=Pseudoloma neurophilia TaxID=146866 RepID=A0A0R0LYT3_9MICR|nr:hypothetical protein M153_24500010072 [Pseudoloma neurophilia]
MTVVLNFESAYYGHNNGKTESNDQNINSDVPVQIDSENIEDNPLLQAFKPSKKLKLEEIKLVIVDTHDSDDESVKEVLTNEEKNNDPIIPETFESFQTCNQQLSRRTTENSSPMYILSNEKSAILIIFFCIPFLISFIAFILFLIKQMVKN